MKKNLLILSFLALVLNLSAKDKKTEILETKRAQETYERLIKSAHPDPEEREHLQPLLAPFAPPLEPSIFLNENMIDAETGESSKMQNESSIAVCPTNPKLIISSAVDYRANSSTWIYISKDGGKTWINKNLGRAFPDWSSSNDPSVYFNAEGVGYLVYGGFPDTRSSGESGVFFAKSTDGGDTWKAHIPVILHKGVQTLDSVLEDKYYIQSDNSPSSPFYKNLYIPWKRVTPRDSATQIVLARSTNGGDNWQTPVNVSDRLAGSSEDTTFGQSFPLCTTGPKGEVYLVWNYGPKHSVGFAKSTDAGLTFTKPRLIQTYKEFGTPLYLSGQGVRHTVKGKVRAESYPVIACDISSTRKGNLCWAGDKIPNIYFSKSTDGGDTWSAAKTIHSDTTNDQFWPWLAIDPKTGDLAIMYADSRRDPNNILVECFVSYSSDGGDTWIDKPAADISSDLRNNPFTGNAFAGDYSGCAFFDGMIYPSWVDMRNAVKDIYDSDVYTALINTRVPQPAYDFTITITPEKPQQLTLNWKNKEKRAFDQPLPAKDYLVLIYRNGSLIKTLPGGSTNYLDENLTAHSKYVYDIKIAADKDTSLVTTATSYAGGAKAPAAPKFISYAGSSDFNINFKILSPSFRADMFTKLVNFKKINLYRAKKLISSVDFTPSDTAKVLDVSDKLSAKKFEVYYFTVSDQDGNESAPCDSIIAYSDEIKYTSEYKETFDAGLPVSYVKGTWANTSEFAFSAPQSLTESPNAKYTVNKNDYIIFTPFKTLNKEFAVKFYHAAIVEQRDTAIIEYSTNYGQTWTNKFKNKTAAFNKNSYPEWSDDVLDAKDWKLENLVIPETNEPVFVRFRMFSGPLATDIGWFIDDLLIKIITLDVNNENLNSLEVKVYPNPARDFIKLFINQNDEEYSYSLYSQIGELVKTGDLEAENGEAYIKTEDLSSGAYYLVLKSGDLPSTTLKINIIR